jgi:uncharacterized membrane protein
MITLELGILIDRPVAAVFHYVTDLTNLPHWQTTVTSIQPVENKPIGVGSTYRVSAEMIGRKIEGLLVIREYEPDSKFGYEMKSGPTTIQAVINFKAAGSGTKITLSGQAEPEGVLKVAEGVLQGQVKAQMEKNLNNLKKVLEAGV